MSWLVPSMAASIIGTLALVSVYFYLFVQYREKYIGVWASGWAFFTLRYVLELSALLTQETPILTIGIQAFSLLNGAFLLWGMYLFQGTGLPRGWIYGFIAGAIWTIIAALSRFSFIVLTLPACAFLGAVYVWTGLGFLRFQKIAGAGKLVIGWAFILWGIGGFFGTLLAGMVIPGQVAMLPMFILLREMGLGVGSACRHQPVRRHDAPGKGFRHGPGPARHADLPSSPIGTVLSASWALMSPTV